MNFRQMNYLRNIYLIISILLLVFIGCGRDNQSSTTSKSANLVKPYLIVKSTGYLPKVELPFLVWDNYEFKEIIVHSYIGGKEKGCVLIEKMGRPIEEGTEIKFLEDAPCIYSRLTTVDGVPRIYNTGLMKILIVSTGEEVWTWSQAVEILD